MKTNGTKSSSKDSGGLGYGTGAAGRVGMERRVPSSDQRECT